MDDASLQQQAAAVGSLLRERGLRVVTVESCTGGYVAKLLTDVAGSSRWFDCGYVTYSNAAKQRDVGVAAETLARHGAVSEATVCEMAAGALQRTGTDGAVAISGVAGPDGGTARNPVGSVWFAAAWRRSGQPPAMQALHHQFSGSRDDVRRQAAAVALALLAQPG
ncbi:MAG: hypothetical protein RL026_1176 [Pseudomonadota bacterium]|jgi:nicotinamide-nucleotide amidase